jgi:hypothetical protein
MDKDSTKNIGGGEGLLSGEGHLVPVSSKVGTLFEIPPPKPTP